VRVTLKETKHDVIKTSYDLLLLVKPPLRRLELPSSRGAHLRKTQPSTCPIFDSAPTTMPVPSQDGSRLLRCLIEGESAVFTVQVSSRIEIGDLKEVVQRKRALDTLKNVGPHTLELWKVSAINESRCEVTWLTPTLQQVNIDLKNHNNHSVSHLKLENLEGVQELTSWKSVEAYWSSQPPTEYLHIIVIQATGE
jgi:Crinkler effector protein N-terminal domain